MAGGHSAAVERKDLKRNDKAMSLVLSQSVMGPNVNFVAVVARPSWPWPTRARATSRDIKGEELDEIRGNEMVELNTSFF